MKISPRSTGSLFRLSRKCLARSQSTISAKRRRRRTMLAPSLARLHNVYGWPKLCIVCFFLPFLCSSFFPHLSSSLYLSLFISIFFSPSSSPSPSLSPSLSLPSSPSLFLPLPLPLPLPPSPSPSLPPQLKGEIESAQDSLRLLETNEHSLHRSKKLYTQSVEQLIKQQSKIDKSKNELNPKNRQQVQCIYMYIHVRTCIIQIIPWNLLKKERHRDQILLEVFSFQGGEGGIHTYMLFIVNWYFQMCSNN